MITKNGDKKREQMRMFSMDKMVPQNHMLRLIERITKGDGRVCVFKYWV